MDQTAKNVALWLNGNYDEETKKAVHQLILANSTELTDAFYTHLSFGTGGMRGLMGVGTNRMNDYTVRNATQGLANYINKQLLTSEERSVFIGFDSRHHSQKFAEETAKVLAANGIYVFLYQELRPTPLVSFGCRLKKCSAAIMITASHNPPEYNGYKVYWKDGGQVFFPHDTGIMQEINKITDPSTIKVAADLKNPLITIISDEIDTAYIVKTSKLQYYPDDNNRFGKDLKIVYTSLHGTGITLMPKVLNAWGFSSISFVEQQIIPDGNFSSAKYPNPEEQATLALGMEKLLDTHGDILIATDPDADRIGIAVLHHGEPVQLDGNQIASLCLEHIFEALISQGKMPEKAAFIKTITTTELFQSICNYYTKPCFNVLPGFKYFAEKILEWENAEDGYQYIFGGEDSYGYLFGTLTRDKDAILSGALICQIALQAKIKGKTLIDLLQDLYQKYGVFTECQTSLHFEESKRGKDKMKESMVYLRHHIPTEIEGIAVLAVEDFLCSVKTDLKTDKKEKILLPSSNILVFWLADNTKLIVRPSGTEPKVKLYCGVVSSPSMKQTLKNSKQKAKQLLEALKQLIMIN